MRVSELIQILQDLDPAANVMIMSQQNWPFENAVAGVAVREEFTDDEEAPEGDPDGDTAPSDVFLVEGTQLRYGSKAAWDVARRY